MLCLLKVEPLLLLPLPLPDETLIGCRKRDSLLMRSERRARMLGSAKIARPCSSQCAFACLLLYSSPSSSSSSLSLSLLSYRVHAFRHGHAIAHKTERRTGRCATGRRRSWSHRKRSARSAALR